MTAPSAVAQPVLWGRLIPFGLDYLVAMIVVSQIWQLAPPGTVASWNDTAVGAVTLGAPVVLRGVFQSNIGRSPFQALVGIRLASDGRPINVFLRTVVLCLTVAVPLVLLVSVLMVLRDPRRQMLHDRAGHTLVVRNGQRVRQSGSST